MFRDGPHGFCGKEAFNHIFIVGYLQFVERKHLHTALVELGMELQHRQLLLCYCSTPKELLELPRRWQ
jgi:hypothetical protein